MYKRLESDGSLRLGTVLVIFAVLVSAMAVMLLIHAETDDSSAEVIESGRCGPDAQYNFYSDGTLEVSGDGWTYNYSGTIRSPWFDYRTEITKIVIGDGITDLGAWTFVGCKNVTELTLPITLNTVGSDMSSAFAGCYRIEKINFTFGTNGYGPGYDAYCGNDHWYQNTPWYESRDSLKEINFANGIIEIGSNTFRELNITSVVLPDSLSITGDYCFFNCTKLTELTMPISLKPFCNKSCPSFQGCTAIEKVTLTYGNGVPFSYREYTQKGDCAEYAPWNMSGIAKSIVISDNISLLGAHMFYNCNIKELTVPVSVRFYSSNAFNAPYRSLEKVTITGGTGDGHDYSISDYRPYIPWYGAPNIEMLQVEEGVYYLGEETFVLSTIENLILPSSLESFGENAFNQCTIKNLTIPISLNAVCNDSSPAFHWVSGIEKVTLTSGWGAAKDYTATKGSNCWYQLTPWYQCRSTLNEIVIGYGIKNIGSDAFRELNITSLVIPDSVQTLSTHSFYHCDKLTDLTIPITLDSVVSNDYPPFHQCNAITNVRLTTGETGVGWDYTAFVPIWCNPAHRATTISLDFGITYIGHNALGGFAFIGSDGSVLEPIAENLSGHTFNGVDGVLHQIDCLKTSCDPYINLCSVVELVSARN